MKQKIYEARYIMTNILIIDSNATTAYRLKKIFEDYPINFNSFSSGREAVSRAYKSQDIIIIDVNLSDEDGFNIIDRLNEMNSEAIIVIVTSDNTRRAFVRGIRLGAADYILKPFNDKYIREKILKHINVSNSKTENYREIAEKLIYDHVEDAILNKSELVVGMVAVYNVNNPMQVLNNVPIVNGLFSRIDNLIESNEPNLHSIVYKGESTPHSPNSKIIILDGIKLSEKEFVVADFQEIANETLADSNFGYELEFMSIPYELTDDRGIIDVLSSKLEQNIELLDSDSADN